MQFCSHLPLHRHMIKHDEEVLTLPMYPRYIQSWSARVPVYFNGSILPPTIKMYDNVQIDLLVVLNLVAPEPETTDSQNVSQYSNRSPILVTLNPNLVATSLRLPTTISKWTTKYLNRSPGLNPKLIAHERPAKNNILLLITYQRIPVYPSVSLHFKLNCFDL